MFYCYVLFMASVGLRVGEAKGIRWGDVKHAFNEKEQKCITQVEVRAEINKVRDNRTAVANSERCKEWLQTWREQIDYNTDGDLVFYGKEKDNKEKQRYCQSQILPISEAANNFSRYTNSTSHTE